MGNRERGGVRIGVSGEVSRNVGPKIATFSVDYDGGTASIELDGEGLGSATGNGPKSSYYACSAGRPAELWPFAFALAVLVVRRRRNS